LAGFGAQLQQAETGIPIEWESLFRANGKPFALLAGIIIGRG